MSSTLIILPTYNERENIEDFVNSIFNYIEDVDILIVDDDSCDGTAQIADSISERDKRVKVLHRKYNRGRGYAGVDAFREALKREDVLYIMEMDADFSHNPVYILGFLQEIKKSDIIIGSRFVAGGRDAERNFARNLLSKSANFFIKRYLGLRINDCSAGYRCFRRRAILSLDLDRIISKGPAIIEETLYILSLKGFRIKELPIDFKDRRSGKTKLNFIKLCGVFIDILIFKRLHGVKDKRLELGEIRKFGFNIALAMTILGLVMFYRGKGHFIWFTAIGGLSLIFAVVFPSALYPFKKLLDSLILWSGRAVNVISLLFVFYLIFTPIGFLLRILRKDILNKKLDKETGSYWIKREEIKFDPGSYERMG